jgi:hypothetical protein
MSIENRDLAVGTKLVGRHKKTEYVCGVVQTEEGVRYQLADGSLHKSPSSAAKAVMGGISANGWRFWSLEGEVPSAKTVKATKVKAVSPPKVQQIRRTRSQKGVPEGQVSWSCASCMATFPVEGDATPDACPDGHPREVVDELAPLS